MTEESARPGTCRSKVGCEAMDEPCTNKILPAWPEGSPACLFHRNRRTSLPFSVQCSSPRMTAAGEIGLFTCATPRSPDVTAFIFDYLIGAGLQGERHIHHPRLIGVQSHSFGLMSLALMSLAHLSISDCTKAPNSSGCIDIVSAPCFLHASFTSARARILLISVLRRVTIGCGVPAGAMTPIQIVAS